MTQFELDYDDLILLTSYMAENGFDAKDIAYAVVKPWKFTDVLDEARKAYDV